MKRLLSIEIEGCRSVRHSKITLGKVNVLLGSNGAGKSNFISVFRLLEVMRAGRLQAYFAESSRAAAFFHKGQVLAAEAAFECVFEDMTYRFALVQNDSGAVVFSREEVIAGGKTEDYGRGHGEQRAESMTSRAFKIYSFHEVRESGTKKARPIEQSEYLLPNADNLAPFLYRIQREYPDCYREMRDAVRTIAPYFDDFVLVPESGEIALKFRQNTGESIFDAAEFSDGTLRFICMAVLFLQPAELLPACILLDEPELGLHPYALSVLGEVIKKAGTQVIISTQSAELLNSFAPADLIITGRSGDGTVFSKPDPEKLKPWLNEGYTLGELWQKNLIGGRLSE